MLPESADLCFLYRCLVKPLWSADNVEVSEASWVCKDANAAFVDSLRSDDSIRELREFEISFTSLIDSPLSSRMRTFNSGHVGVAIFF